MVTLVSGIAPFGAVLSATYGNGLALLQSWGNDGRLASKRLYRWSTSANLSLLTYGYDNDDNIASIADGVDAMRNITYGYDPVGRLSQSVVAAGSVRRQDFISDKNGNLTRTENRTNPTDVNPVSTTAYALNSGSNRLATAISASGTRAISYDARGNTAGETRPGAVTVTTGYDGYARLTRYQNSGSATLTNGYNGLDDRVMVTTAGAPADVRHYVFDQSGRMLGEYGASAATVKAETIWLTPDAANDNGADGGGDGADGYAPLALAVGTTLYWEHGNHLGVPLVITDSGGNTAAPTGYTKVGFPGQTQTLSDLYCNRYRDYDPTTGRYIQADPIGLAGGQNNCAYAANNPVNATDPMGLQVAMPFPVCFAGPWGAAACAAAPVVTCLLEASLRDAIVPPRSPQTFLLAQIVPLTGKGHAKFRSSVMSWRVIPAISRDLTEGTVAGKDMEHALDQSLKGNPNVERGAIIPRE